MTRSKYCPQLSRTIPLPAWRTSETFLNRPNISLDSIALIRFRRQRSGYIESDAAKIASTWMPNIFDRTAHRPWPLPTGPWIMSQSWHDLLFAHWPIDAARVRPSIPAALELDTFDGQAWIGIVPFSMSGVRLRWTPALPGFSSFPELNVRTYVVAQSRPGVWFFSLDAQNRLAVAAARVWFHLPYFYARMTCDNYKGLVHYRCERRHRRAPAGMLEARYRPAGETFEAPQGTLEHFLTERYCLYAARERRVYRGEIHHPPWQLQVAEAELMRNTMAEAAGFAIASSKPLLHFARRQDMVAWPPRRIA
jgi:uncharacterized protein